MSDDMQRLLIEQSAYLLGRDSEADRIRELEAENARLREAAGHLVSIRQMREASSRIAELDFELRAKDAELEIANGEIERLREDAARFRALMRCGRIKPQGSAGVHPGTGERTYPDEPGSVHFGAEFWVQPEREPSNATIWGRHCLRALADDILAYEALSASGQG